MTEQIDHPSRLKLFAIATVVAMSVLLVGVVVLFAVDTNRDAIERIDREIEERRDIGCKGAERQHAQEIRDLERSYEIYENPPPSFREILQEPFAIQGLREDIRNAENDADRFGVFVSPFCDDRGIGEKEPDPVMPDQPQEVQDLLRAAGG